MITDNYLLFSDAQSVEGAAGTIASTNVLELNAQEADDGLYADFIIDTSVTSTGAATLAVQIKTSDTISSGALSGTIVTLAQTDAYAKADLTAGSSTIPPIRLPRGLLRYVQVYYVIGGATIAAGAISARLVNRPQTNMGVG